MLDECAVEVADNDWITFVKVGPRELLAQNTRFCSSRVAHNRPAAAYL